MQEPLPCPSKLVYQGCQPSRTIEFRLSPRQTLLGAISSCSLQLFSGVQEHAVSKDTKRCRHCGCANSLSLVIRQQGVGCRCQDGRILCCEGHSNAFELLEPQSLGDHS